MTGAVGVGRSSCPWAVEVSSLADRRDTSVQFEAISHRDRESNCLRPTIDQLRQVL